MGGRAHLPPLQIDRKVARGDSLEVCEASCFSIRPAERSHILKTCQFGWQPGNAKSTSLSATTATSFNLLTNINDRNDRNIHPAISVMHRACNFRDPAVPQFVTSILPQLLSNRIHRIRVERAVGRRVTWT